MSNLTKLYVVFPGTAALQIQEVFARWDTFSGMFFLYEDLRDPHTGEGFYEFEDPELTQTGVGSYSTILFSLDKSKLLEALSLRISSEMEIQQRALSLLRQKLAEVESAKEELRVSSVVKLQEGMRVRATQDLVMTINEKLVVPVVAKGGLGAILYVCGGTGFAVNWDNGLSCYTTNYEIEAVL